MAVDLVESEEMYMRIFADQTGYGLPRYRGAPMAGGSFWGRLVTFAKGLFRQAAPHVSQLIAQAHPHAKNFATSAVNSAIDTAVTKVTDTLRKVQEGQGKSRWRKKKTIKAAKQNKKTRKKVKKKTRDAIDIDENF